MENQDKIYREISSKKYRCYVIIHDLTVAPLEYSFRCILDYEFKNEFAKILNLSRFLKQIMNYFQNSIVRI